MSKAGAKIIEGLKDAVAGNFSAVTIEGQRWVRAPEWLPIATAPKDGTDILACDARVIGWMLVVSYDAEDLPVCWLTADGPAYHHDMFTHWMPLPEPPVSP